MPEYLKVLGHKYKEYIFNRIFSCHIQMEHEEAKGLPPVTGAVFDPPHCTPYLCSLSGITPYKMEQSREFNLCFQFC